jgi:periplasmic copper chaperone A
MIRPVVWLLAGALALQACSSGDDPALRVSHVRVFAPLPGRAASVAYLDIENVSGRPVTLETVSSPAFARAELHETTIVDGVASMHALASLVLEPRSQTRLAPGGKHIMLIDPVKGLLPGATILIELHYDRSGLLPVEAEVQTRLEDDGN